MNKSSLKIAIKDTLISLKILREVVMIAYEEIESAKHKSKKGALGPQDFAPTGPKGACGPEEK